jgi:ARG and Rhodanese-Phosphatase-superfamily-associated Protein domain
MTATSTTETIQLGDPVEHRGIVVAPLFPRLQPRAAYLTFQDVYSLGFAVEEVDTAGSVPELAVHNPLEHNVLLYDGEELVGAKQNRILNVTVLVAGESRTVIPVSCVEEGRWSARSALFSSARHATYPELRRRKAKRLSAQPFERGAAQSIVWDEVRAKSARHGVASATGAQADIFEQRGKDLAALRKRFALQPGQSGALLAVGDRICLDYLSQPDAFQSLYPKLLNGYLLDAIERLDRKPATPEDLGAFYLATETAPRSRRPSTGLGEDVRFRGNGVVGSGLELDGELLQLCAFSSEEEGASSTIARPSLRRA